ncbi:diheme cytochrome c-553 [Candidatus Poribacteria bacterium]|nr:diheme cytochrome c-553 [Candidatus Poribacteria bacterium]
MNRSKYIIGLAVIVIIVAIGISIKSVDSQNDMVERGKYIVDAVAACGFCHTPRTGTEYNEDMYLAGHVANSPYSRYDMSLMQRGIFLASPATLTAFSGPFGSSFATNLTPDKETGLGEWTEDMFIKALRTGHHQGNVDNRKIFPPMPWKHYAQMNDSDLKAIWAYLRTIKPVKNEVSPVLNPMGRPY